jgi:hypothetical protein
VVIDQRDYTGNIQATDRVHFAQNEIHPAIEMGDPNQIAPVTHVAYLRGSTINVTVRWRNWKEQTVNGTLTWQSARLACPGAIAPIEYINLGIAGAGSVPVSMAANGGQFQTTLTLTNVPDYVAVGGLELKFDMPLTSGPETANNGTAGGFITWERVCLLDGYPTGLQSVPWVDFLEYSCRWGFGSSAGDVTTALTFGIHYNTRCLGNRISYDPAVNILWAVGKYSSTPLDLSHFFNINGDPWIGPSFGITLDCRDYSAMLQLSFYSHGVTSSTIWVEQESVTGHHGFQYWPLRRAGASSFHGDHFNFHVVVGAGFMTYDSPASYLFSPDGAYWMNPGVWPTAVHWQQHANGSAGTGFYGLAYHPYTEATLPLMFPPSNISVAMPKSEINLFGPSHIF